MLAPLRWFAALVVGVVSLALAVVVVLVLQQLVDLNLFTLMWFGFIPIGAFVVGLGAAGGYYVGAIKLHIKPTRNLAVTMLVVAALTQVALYYSQYALTQTESGQPLSELVSFPRFVGWSLSHSRYDVIVFGYKPGQVEGFDVGIFGYVAAGLQFLALIAAGFVAYAVLADKPYCDTCHKFPSQKLEVKLPFEGDMTVIDELRRLPPLSDEYFAALTQLAAGNGGALELLMSRCPSCHKEAVFERPMLAKEGALKYQPLAYRTVWTPNADSIEPKLDSIRRKPSA